jgi:hypothetical protein
MGSSTQGRPVVPILLGIAMLGIVLAAALAPNLGGVQAQSGCQYANCSSSNGNGIPLDWIALAIVLAAILIIAALFAVSRRRKKPPTTAQPWVPGAAGGPGAAPTGPQPPSAEPPAAAYMEHPGDVGSVPAGVAGGAGAAAGAEEGGDIDSLMAELDKISGEILKRGQPGKKGGDTGGASSTADEKSDS